MARVARIHLLIILLGALGGCATAPSTNIKSPLTARPVAHPASMVNDGSIYQPEQGAFLFTDQRPMHVGDTLRVNLVENTQITRSYDNKQNRTGNATFSLPAPTLFGRSNVIGSTSVAPTSAGNMEAKTALTNNSSFSGGITVTVTEVLDNGNLKVAGEKQVSLDNDTQYIRLAGVVNPRDIMSDGTVNSNQLADVKLESKSSTAMDRSTLTSMLARFFLNVLPF